MYHTEVRPRSREEIRFLKEIRLAANERGFGSPAGSPARIIMQVQ
jgi:hypothetical protein